ncbi:MAG TPA: hypothetical protein VKB96_03895 [Gammaproteobacteria bacterium]|nr:hypothetical protein [Gammaproteobacteria bacterium]
MKDSDECKIPSLQKYTAYISRTVCEEMRYLDREVWQEQTIDDLVSASLIACAIDLGSRFLAVELNKLEPQGRCLPGLSRIWKPDAA